MNVIATPVPLEPGCEIVEVVVLQGFNKLSNDEAADLSRCEEVVRQHFRSYFETATAIREIHDRKLYRAEFETFEAYCEQRLGISRQYAHRILVAGEILENVLRPLGNIRMPENESQIRPLIRIPREKIPAVWRRVVKKAGLRAITASIVSAEVAAFDEKLGKPSGRENCKNPAVLQWQRDLQARLYEAAEAVGDYRFADAAHHLRQVLIRVDLEAEREERKVGEDSSR